MLHEDNSMNLFNLGQDFGISYVPALRNSMNLVGRCSGGLAIIWRKSDTITFRPINFSERIAGLKLTVGNETYLLLNVYCFCDYKTTESLINYRSLMAELAVIIAENQSDLILVGDMNADPHKGRFFREFSSFVEENNLHISDLVGLPQCSYTYISPSEACSTSWLDHVVTSRLDMAKNFDIFYGHAFYDHLPIYFELVMPCQISFPPIDRVSDLPQNGFVHWDKVTEAHKKEYECALELLSLQLTSSVLVCNVQGCSDVSHHDSISTLYDDIIDCINAASGHFPCRTMTSKKQRVVGWNRYCKDLYAKARSPCGSGNPL